MEPILEAISEALARAGEKQVFYGIAFDAGMKRAAPWNYTVYSRARIDQSANKTGVTRLYTVAVTREDYLPEEVLNRVTEELEAIPGTRISGGIEYDYALNPGTGHPVEQAIITIAKAEKR
ncbi:hypothetical protein [Adlercreutzia muris]|uniref:Uncharacterized protein n=1 Tax=Adlercreutzia muris TaxID=1796610 RepID=A0A7C8BU35_9ACTN|nr:hypothetical protein [Adlercreutzia muris]KAB1647990.1 hypothetical protein F8D48_06775 [Adlercreutzia muris]MCR2027717.1 hypothetical protein [Adlercreutzia muris]